MMINLIPVAIGGALGASARFLFVQAVVRFTGPGFPWWTFGVNVIGSFLMGIAFIFLTDNAPKWMPLVMTGVLGGFTTFSAFSLDAFQLYERGQVMAALGYVSGSLVFSIAALLAGVVVARAVIA